MIEFRSYLMRKLSSIKEDSRLPHTGVYDDRYFLEHAELCFVDIEDEREVRALGLQADKKHFSGAVLLRSDGEVLMDHRFWDVDVWTVFLMALQQMHQNGTAEVRFSERPVVMRWHSLGENRLHFELQARDAELVSTTLSEQELLHVVRLGLMQFYEQLTRVGVQSERVRGTLDLLKQKGRPDLGRFFHTRLSGQICTVTRSE